MPTKEAQTASGAGPNEGSVELKSAAPSARELAGPKNTAELDLADLLYNRACYRSLWADQISDPRQREILKRQAEADVKEMARLNPQDLREAAGDRDFDTLLTDARPEMRTLLASFGLQPRQASAAARTESPEPGDAPPSPPGAAAPTPAGEPGGDAVMQHASEVTAVFHEEQIGLGLGFGDQKEPAAAPPAGQRQLSRESEAEQGQGDA